MPVQPQVAATAVTIDCDVLGMSGGWNPAVHLTVPRRHQAEV